MPETVTPCVGVWIEILVNTRYSPSGTVSLPAWECGLKWRVCTASGARCGVTPCVGVWIEILILPCCSKRPARHSLRGSVD